MFFVVVVVVVNIFEYLVLMYGGATLVDLGMPPNMAAIMSKC